MLRAYDKQTGKEVGVVRMPAIQSGSPMTYMVNGKQRRLRNDMKVGIAVVVVVGVAAISVAQASRSDDERRFPTVPARVTAYWSTAS